MLFKIMQGMFIGLALVLPGLSGGTVILILGFYRRFLEDIASFNFKPYFLLAVGIIIGGLFGVYTISFLLEHFSVVIMSFLLGMLLASAPMVINSRGSKALRPQPIVLGILGFLLTWFYICEPARSFTVLPPGGFLHFFLGGTLASATMLLPGVSGSAVLIILNLYDEVIFAFSNWEIFKLAFFLAGFVVGILLLARLLSAIYRRYPAEVSFLLAGMIVGSTRSLLPEQLSVTFLVFALLGAFAVLYLTRKHITAPGRLLP